jgi:hypothetical protein
MSACSRCDAPTVPHTEFCLDCGHDGGVGQPRIRRRLEITEINLSDHDKLVRLLATLSQEPAETIGFLIDRGRFEIDIDVTKAQGASLEAMLATAGLHFRSSEQVYSSPSHGLRWAGGRKVGARLAITVAMGGAALAFGVPLVPIAAVLTSLILVGSSARFVPARLSVSKPIADQTLAVVDPAVLAEVRAARAGISDPGAARRLRTCVDHVAEITWVVRANGAHLLQPDLGRLDGQIHQLLRQTSKLAVSADRLRAPEEEAAPRAPRVKLDEARSEIERSLEDIEQALARMRNDVRELQGAEVRGQTLTEPRRVLTELRIGIVTALEMAEIAAQLRRRDSLD